MSTVASRHDQPFRAFALDGRHVDPAALAIRSAAADTTIEPKVMALLALLAERPGRLWTRSELIDRLWPDGGGGDESLTRAVYMLRKALGDPHGLPDAIVTVPKLGYRLDATVAYGDQRLPDTVGEALAWQEEAAADGLSVAVMPIEDMSPESGSGYLAQGMTRDLTALLSRVPRLRVAAYSSVTGRAGATAAEIAEAVNVRYVVSGTLTQRQDLIRLRMEMVDCRSHALVWSQRYDTGLDAFFDVQEDAILSISTAISSQVKVIDPSGDGRGPFNPSAYELVQEAETLRLNYGRATAGHIVEKLGRVMDIEPHNAVARAALAVQLSQNVVSQWVKDPDATRGEANRHIELALAAAPSDPEVLAAAGVVAAMFHRPDEAIGYLERSIRRDPNNAHALAVLGWQRCIRLSDPRGVELITLAEERAPHHPRFGLWATYRATAHLFMLDYANGVVACREAVARTPNYYQPSLSLAWALTGLKRRGEAEDAVRRAQRLEASDIVEKFVLEVKKWAANSPNAAACCAVLDELNDRAAALR